MSPAFNATRHVGLVAVIDTSHDTAPAGSKYFASERNRRFVTPSRVTVRSSYSPPGCRWPAVPTRVVSRLTTHWCAAPIACLAAGVLASFGKVYLPLWPL